MGERFTVRLSEENAEWVAEESADRDRSKAWIIAEAVSAARGAESTYMHRTGAHGAESQEDGGGDLDDVTERLADLEERVDELEAEGRPGFDIAQSGVSGAPPAEGPATTAPEPVASAEPTGESDDVDVDPIGDALAGWSYGRTDEEQAANDTVARASLEWLRDDVDGVVRQSDVPLEELAEDDPRDRTPDTLWRSVIRGAWNHATGQGYVDKPDSRGYEWVGEIS